MSISYNQHLKNSQGMSMPDRLDNEMLGLKSFQKEARELVKKKLGFWKWYFLTNRRRVEGHVAACLFYDDKIYWENMKAW